MDWGKKAETGEGYLHLTKEENNLIERGGRITKPTADAYGEYRLTLKLDAVTLFDKNRKALKRGDRVIMPEPTQNDDYWTQGGFEATVCNYKDAVLVTVEDCEGNGWDVEARRVQKIVEPSARVQIEDINLTFDHTVESGDDWQEHYEWEGTVSYRGKSYKGNVPFKYVRECSPSDGAENTVTLIGDQPAEVSDEQWDEIHDEIEEAVVSNHNEHPDEWH